MTAPVQVLRPRAISDLLLSCEHASARIPTGFRADAPTRRLLATHRGADLGAWEITRVLSARLRATAIGGAWSRLVTDLNRPPAAADLIVAAPDGVAVSFNTGIGAAERARRIARFHAPYHQAIDLHCRRLRAAGRRPLLLAVHSFTPLLEPRRRKFDLGLLFDASEAIIPYAASAFRRQGFRVRLNRPYSGRRGFLYSARRHGLRHLLPHFELEFNQGSLGSLAHVRDVGKRASEAIFYIMKSILDR